MCRGPVCMDVIPNWGVHGLLVDVPFFTAETFFFKSGRGDLFLCFGDLLRPPFFLSSTMRSFLHSQSCVEFVEWLFFQSLRVWIVQETCRSFLGDPAFQPAILYILGETGIVVERILGETLASGIVVEPVAPFVPPTWCSCFDLVFRGVSGRPRAGTSQIPGTRRRLSQASGVNPLRFRAQSG